MDGEFARAYAATAMAYYTLDENQGIKQYTDSINFYADQAMFYDSKLPQSLIAKALFYMNSREYELAVPYLKKHWNIIQIMIWFLFFCWICMPIIFLIRKNTWNMHYAD